MVYRSSATFLWLVLTFYLGLPCFPATAQENAFAAKGFLTLAEGRALDRFWVKDLQGTEIDATQLLAAGTRGPVYLHLWAPACLPCVKEIKELDQVVSALAAKNISVIALAQDYDGTVTVPAFARRHGVKSLPLYIDEGKRAFKKSGARGLPTTYRVDPQGRLIEIHEGAVNWAGLIP